MNNVSMIGTVSGLPRIERDGNRRWAVLSIMVRSGREIQRFEVLAQGRAMEVVLERRPGADSRLAIDGRLGRGQSGGVVVVAEHALWLSASQIRDLAGAVRPIASNAAS